jgi:hypothetical protein
MLRKGFLSFKKYPLMGILRIELEKVTEKFTLS